MDAVIVAVILGVPLWQVEEWLDWEENQPQGEPHEHA